MHIGVAIVGFRNRDDIVSCLGALSGSAHADFEVVICENGGPEAYAALTAALPAALPGGQPVTIVLASGNLGYAGGVNVCLDHLPAADACWVLNPDTEPTPHAMGALIARLQAGDCDAAGSTVRLPDGIVQSYGGHWERWLARAVSLGNGQSADQAPDAARIEARQNYLNGASMMVSRRFIDVAGPMREDYFLYCEEVEWCLRGLSRGLKLGFAADADVLHQQGTTTGNEVSFKRRALTPVYLNERNRLLLTRDCFPGLLPAVVVSSLAVIFMKYARRGAWRQVGYALRGWWAGILGQRGKPPWITT